MDGCTPKISTSTKTVGSSMTESALVGTNICNQVGPRSVQCPLLPIFWLFHAAILFLGQREVARSIDVDFCMSR
jgi:hypothetical protein